MIPRMNSREMAKAMQRMGIKQEEVEADRVIIQCKNKDIVFENPQVAKVNMMGQETWQITGKGIEQEKSAEPEINEDDIKTVMEQTGKSEDEVVEAIKRANGDLAQAIIDLS